MEVVQMTVLYPIMLNLHAFIQKLAAEQQKDINELFNELNVPNHPTDHPFEDDPEAPGTCRKCHWICENVVCTQCMFPAREHAGFVSLEVFLRSPLDLNELFDIVTRLGSKRSRRYREN